MVYEGRLRFIGVVESKGELSTIKIFSEYEKKLSSLNNFFHLIILYWFHLQDNEKERSTLQVVLRRHTGAPQVNVFASRNPSRPNPIGFCVVELISVEYCILTVRGLDTFEGSPIVDIKPYVPKSDAVPNATIPEWVNTGIKT